MQKYILYSIFFIALSSMTFAQSFKTLGSPKDPKVDIRWNRFYDYDEISHMNEIRIRRVPEPSTPEQEMSSEPWFHVGENDFFPEQFEFFVINHPKVRERFLAHHPELLEPEYWQQVQNVILEKKRIDVFPYRQEKRFKVRFPELYQ